MKLLLDENLPHLLRHELPGHDCYTVAYMKWRGVKNGALLALAAGAGFEALVTMDSTLEYEQNPKTLPLAVVVLEADTNEFENIQPLIPALLAALTTLAPQQVTHIPRA